MYNLFWRRQKLPKVNKELALKLMEEGDDEAELASRKKKGKVGKQRLQKNVFPWCWIHMVITALLWNEISVKTWTIFWLRSKYKD